MAQPGFTDIRDLMSKVTQLSSDIDSMKGNGATLPQNLAPMVGQLVAGALSVIEERIARFEQRSTEHEQRMANLVLEVRAAVPKMPDLAPLVSAIESMAQRSDQQPVDPPGLAAMSAGMTEVLSAVREMCTRMDRPIVREGVAELPSGPVRLRITETKAR
jgi:hypothetical protein